MVISKVPTNSDNKEIRGQVLEILSGIETLITLVIGYQVGTKYIQMTKIRLILLIMVITCNCNILDNC